MSDEIITNTHQIIRHKLCAITGQYIQQFKSLPGIDQHNMVILHVSNVMRMNQIQITTIHNVQSITTATNT